MFRERRRDSIKHLRSRRDAVFHYLALHVRLRS